MPSGSEIITRSLVAFCVGAGLGVPLAAQTPTDTLVRARDSSGYVLPEVTVQATRRTTSAFATPLAVTTVQPTDAFGRAGYGLDDALSLVPGVLAQSRYGNQDVRIVIRGFGARGAGDRSNAGTSRGIRVLLDGMPETEPDGRTSFDGIDLASAEQIEVVRSNASSLWGNAAGGVITVSTRPASPGALQAEATAGGFGLQRYVARASTQLGKSPVWGSFVHSRFDGWRAHSGSDRSLLNLGTVAAVGSRTELGVFGMGSANDFDIPGPLTAAQIAANPKQANATYLARNERRRNRVARLGLTVDHAAGEPVSLSGMLFVAPKFLQRSERGTFRDFTRYHVGGNLVGRVRVPYSASLRGVFTAGADEAYQDGAILFYSLAAGGTRGDTLRDDKREGTNNIGVFLQHELELNDRLSLSLGARYDAIRYYYDSQIDPSLDATKAFTHVSPKLGLNYRLSPAHSLYLNVGGGVEAPAGNETDPAGTFGQDTVTAINPLLEPITSTTYEVGTKHLLHLRETGFLRSLSYDAALYLTRVKNEIVPYRGGRFYFTAGRARRAGAELGLRAGLTGGLSLGAAFTYSDNTYTEYVVDSVHYGQPGRLADFSGNRIVGVPKLIVGTQVALEPSALSALRFQIDVEGNSGYFADDANTLRVAGYAIASATVGLRRPVPLGAGVAAAGFVTVSNLFDRRYVASAYLNPDVVDGVPVAFEPGLPRRLLLSVSLSRAGAAGRYD
jgi:iron complex outermembrane receptor protein